jgi:hypothetical protein
LALPAIAIVVDVRAYTGSEDLIEMLVLIHSGDNREDGL